MKTFKCFVCILFLLTGNTICSQNSYSDIWFASHCDYCKVHPEQEKWSAIIATNPWHNAHISFAKKDFKQTEQYILKDTKTNDTLKQLLQKQVLSRLGVIDEAKKYLLSISTTKNKDLKQFVYKSLGILYLKNKDYDSASIYFEKALIVPLKQSYYFKNEIYENQALIFSSINKYDQAEQLYHKVLKTYQNNQDSIQIARMYSNLGNLYFEQYKDQKAKHYLDSAYNMSKPLKDLRLKSSITYNLYLVSEVLKEQQKAINYLKEYTSLNDSLQQQNTIWQIAQQREAFGIEQKQQELNIKTAERNTFIAISIAILVVLSIVFVFYRKLVRQHAQINNLNTKLNKTNTVKNQLFTIIAHDLRSPVARLKQTFQLRKVDQNKEAISSDKNVYKIIDSLSLLLDNLLNWALSQSDLLSVQKEWFPLWPVLSQIEQQYGSLIAEKDIQFKIEVPTSVLVFGDMEIFKIIIRNCLDNAIKFTPKGGDIVISGIVEKESFTVFITDSGIGIPEKVLKSIFEVQSNKIQKDTTGRKSSGLGLMLTKSMIQLNGGSIQIRPNPDGGTIVNISLPYKKVA